MKISRSMLYLILMIMVAAIIFSFVLQESLSANWQLLNEPLHTTAEALCGLAAIVMAIFLFQRKEEKYGGKLFLLALGFLSTGILDIFHGATVLGRGFVLLRSVSTLVCSFWFVLIWFPQLASDKEMAWKRWAAVAVSGGSIFFAIWTLVARETLPVMVEDEKFTVTAIAFNLTAGIFFLAASARFLIDFSRSGKLEIYLFGCMTMLFGLTGFMFPFSTVWDSTWWMWHLLRVIAYAIVLVTVIREYRFMASNLRVALKESKQIEESLCETNEYLENLFNYANAPIIVWDTLFIITRFNNAFEKLSGYEAIEVRGKRIDLLFPKDKVDFSVDLIKKAVSGKRWETVEIEILRKDKNVRTVLWNSANIFDKEGREVVATIAQGQDITERKQADERFRSAELRYRMLFEQSPAGILIIDPETSLPIEFNDTAHHQLGYSRDEFARLHISDYEAIMKLDEIQARIEKVLREGRDDFETQHRTKFGELKNVFVTVQTIKLSGRNVFHCVFRDITEIKKTEEELRKVKDELELRVTERTTELRNANAQLRTASLYTRNLIEASLDPLVTISPDGKITDVNKATELVTGVNRDRLIGSDFSDYFIEPEKAKEGYQQVFSKGFVADYPLAIRHASGRVTDVHYNATVYKNEFGEVQGVFAAARDITERKQAEEKLRAASLYARSLIEASLDPLVTISPNGKITDVNKATELVTGVNRDRLIGSDFSDYFTEPEKAREGYQQVFSKGFVVDYPLTIRHILGNVTEVLYNATVYRNEAGEVQGVFAAARDITERKRAEEEIRKLNKDLEHRAAELANVNKELETFSYSASHDLRAPLRGIDGFSQALLDDYADKLDVRGKDYLHRVRSASQRMGQLIDAMLALSGLTRSELHRKIVDMSALVKTIVKELQQREPQRSVEFVITEGIKVSGDEQLLRAALWNLLENAWKFTGKHTTARIEFGVTNIEEKTVYYIRDDGAGFDMAYVHKLFGSFQRLHTTSEYPGIGIGLATVQRVIHRHGGQLWAEGAVEHGATFYFTLN